MVNSCRLIRYQARASCTPRYESLGVEVAIQAEIAVMVANSTVNPTIESIYGSTNTCAPKPKSTPPTITPPRRRNCFCRDDPMVDKAVATQVIIAVLMAVQATD